ncbi:tetratricopeptide repeat protein, partial [Variovorax sp. CT11-76]
SSHGRAWQLADQAFKAYGRGDFETALARADAALRLQPAAPRVHLLRVYALQKLGRNDEAARAAERAIDQGHGNAALRTALANL